MLKELGMTRSKMIAAGIYMTFQASMVVIVLYFQLIPFEQMGIRTDTLFTGIIGGVFCQLPLIAIGFTKRGAESLVGGDNQLAIMAKHAKLHGYAGAFDAPIAELFWSGIVLTSVITLLGAIGLPAWSATVLGLFLGVGLHLCSHVGPLQFLVGHSWVAFFLTMFMNRATFLLTGNIVAPILGHFLGSWYGLLLFRIKKII
jgi:hypothetical protein